MGQYILPVFVRCTMFGCCYVYLLSITMKLLEFKPGNDMEELDKIQWPFNANDVQIRFFFMFRHVQTF